MITPHYARQMAVYNRWQNNSLYTAAGTLSDADRQQPRGAFFGSIHATLNHILWGDQIWLSRFSDNIEKPTAANIPTSVAQYPDWDELCRAREEFDQVIIDWAQNIDPDWLAGELTYYSGAAGREMSKPVGLLVAHVFNHQTHHRGQVHCMLTQAGAKPDDTDLPFGPADSLAG